MPEAYTTAEVAEALRVNPRTVLRLVHSGRLAKVPHLPVGTIRIAADELRRFLAEKDDES